MQVKPDRFAVVRDELRKEYQNMKYSQPYSLALYRADVALGRRRWTADEYSQVVDIIEEGHVMQHVRRMMGRCEGKCAAALRRRRDCDCLRRG